MINAGRLRHRVTIQSAAESRDSYGQAIKTWSAVASVGSSGVVWASIEPLQGREYIAASAEQAEVSTRIRIRHAAGITPKMRVVWGSRIYEIKSVIEVQERNREMQLMCIEDTDG